MLPFGIFTSVTSYSSHITLISNFKDMFIHNSVMKSVISVIQVSKNRLYSGYFRSYKNTQEYKNMPQAGQVAAYSPYKFLK